MLKFTVLAGADLGDGEALMALDGGRTAGFAEAGGPSWQASTQAEARDLW
jgi:hypothetical protein